jgi:hypothetical protein
MGLSHVSLPNLSNHKKRLTFPFLLRLAPMEIMAA